MSDLISLFQSIQNYRDGLEDAKRLFNGLSGSPEEYNLYPTLLDKMADKYEEMILKAIADAS